MTENYCKFGALNTQTGEFQEGYIDSNKQMKFKPIKWWQKLFSRRPQEKEYIGKYTYSSKLPWSDWYDSTIAMYKYYNPYTGEIYKIEGTDGMETIRFDVGAYKKGHMVPIRK